MPSHCISAADPLPAPLEFLRFRERSLSLLVDRPSRALSNIWTSRPFRWGRDMGAGPSVILELPNHHARLHLRRVLHGGWAGGLWGNRVAGLRRSERELEVTRQMRHPRHTGSLPRAGLGPAAWIAMGSAPRNHYEEQTSDGIDLLCSQPSPTEILDAAGAAGTAIRRLHDQGCQHADLHIGNLLFRSEDSHFEAIIVDSTKPEQLRHRRSSAHA